MVGARLAPGGVVTARIVTGGTLVTADTSSAEREGASDPHAESNPIAIGSPIIRHRRRALPRFCASTPQRAPPSCLVRSSTAAPAVVPAPLYGDNDRASVLASAFPCRRACAISTHDGRFLRTPRLDL